MFSFRSLLKTWADRAGPAMTIGKRFVVAAPTAHFLLRKGGGCSRRMPLRSAMLVATVVSLAALPAAASAQTRAPLTDVSSASGPVSIDVNARPITSFDQRDRSHVRFGALQFRSGLILTSPYRRFGGL